jgi:hypothetical protein
LTAFRSLNTPARFFVCSARSLLFSACFDFIISQLIKCLCVCVCVLVRDSRLYAVCSGILPAIAGDVWMLLRGVGLFIAVDGFGVFSVWVIV